MSDQKKYSAFSRLMRPAAACVLAIAMASLGALAATYLQSGKSPAHEENHSTANDHTRSATTKEGNLPGEPIQSESLQASADGNTGVNPGVNQSPAPSPDPATTAFPVSGVDQGSHDAPQVAAAASLHHSDLEVPGESNDQPESKNDEHGTRTEQESFADAAAGFGEPLSGASSDGTAAGTPTQHDVPPSDSHAERSAAVQRQSASALVSKNPKNSREDMITQQTVNYMAIADEELASGNYVQAMRSYQALRQESQGTPAAAVLFRLALCAEAAGRHSAAIEAYRKISGTQADPAWVGVSRYGEARCLASMKRHAGLQTDLLRRVILDETEFLPTVRGEVLHLIGRDLWREQTTLKVTDLLADRTLTVPEWSADPVRLLDELPMLIHETRSPAGPINFQVLSADDPAPDGILVRLYCAMTPLESVFTKLIISCGLKCEISEQARQLMSGRSQQIRVSARSLALLLDGMTICCGLAWREHDSVVEIVPASELSASETRQSRLRAAERILRIAVMEGPNSPQVGHSRLVLGSLLVEQERTADAVQFLQVQIESSPRSVVETEAAFNLAKCLMMLNERDDAKQAFLRSIDASGGQTDVKIASYIFHSRLLLEDNQARLAVSSMMRGLSLSEGSELEPFAALQLASIYLMLENPQGANDVLMSRRDELADGPGRAGAAFLSSLARFRAAVLSDRREREGAAVVSALSEFRPEQFCGGHWGVLLAEACDELGLAQQSTEACLLALNRLPPSDLRNATIMHLASRYQADNQLEEARLLLATLTSSEADQMTQQARLRSAALALEQNHPQEAILACRQLIAFTDTPQIEREALRIMGKAFERQQNHQAAIYCFAGLLPDAENLPDSAPRTGPDLSESTGGTKP